MGYQHLSINLLDYVDFIGWVQWVATNNAMHLGPISHERFNDDRLPPNGFPLEPNQPIQLTDSPGQIATGPSAE